MKSTATGWIVSAIIAVAVQLAPANTESVRAQETASPAATAPTPAAPVPAASPPAAPAPASADPLAKDTRKPVVVPKPVVIPYDQQIYRVSISLGVAPEASIPDRNAGRMVDQLRGLVTSRIGVWWQCDIRVAPAGEPLSRAMLAQRTAESWNAALESHSVDKHFTLTLDRSGSEYRLSGVEWDRASQTVTSILERTTYDRRLVPALAAGLVFELFRPLVSIEKVLENHVELRIRGGEYLPPDLSLTPYAAGDHVTAFVRHLGKNRELKRMQHIPWTTIRMDMVERGYMEGTIISAFKAPLAGSRRRMEMLGLKIRPMLTQTQVQVIPRGKPQSPMAGYRVEVLDRLETKDDKVTDRVTLRTDRDGTIVLPADPEKPIRYLIAYSGLAPLAKAPVYPGHVARLVLEAPDDSPRLTVEAETELLESELVDLVARRAVIMARARGAAKKADWDSVAALEKQVDALPNLEQFLARIEALKNPAVQVAKQNKDRAQESRIVRMCKTITDTAILHLDPLKVKEFHMEIAEEKKAK